MVTAGKDTHLGVQHDLRRSVPTGGDVLRQEAGVIVVRVSHAGQTKIADLQRKNVTTFVQHRCKR